MMHVVGIDEAGRGPLAGPVAVGAVRVSGSLKKSFFKGIKDSKQLTPEERELWFALAHEAREKGELDFAVTLISERVIDRRGIAHAIRLGIKRCLKTLNVSNDSRVFLDGGISAPEEFEDQISIIKGDEKVPIISLASIVAKVVRDRKMVKFARKFPQFGFESNKGYGTRAHREAILKYGRTELHRKTFLSGLTRQTVL